MFYGEDKFGIERYSHDVRDICTNVHDHVTGISDWCSKQHMQNCVSWLQMRLDSWEERDQYPEYDAAIKLTVIAAIKEGEKYIKFVESMEAEGKYFR